MLSKPHFLLESSLSNIILNKSIKYYPKHCSILSLCFTLCPDLWGKEHYRGIASKSLWRDYNLKFHEDLQKRETKKEQKASCL